MLHHVTLWVPDLARAAGSWRWLLGQLGYTEDSEGPAEASDRVLVFRQHGVAVVLEQSADMVPGMLHSRLRPGLNHLAFSLADGRELGRIVGESAAHGWSALPTDGHPIAGGAEVAYLEDRDGFEVELVAPSL